MHILHIASTLVQGGIASSLGYSLPWLARQPDVDVEIAILYEVGPWGESLARQGIEVYACRLQHKYDPRALPRLAALLGSGGYDVVHVHGWPDMLFGAMLARPGRRPPLVLSEHNVTNRRRRPVFRPLDRLMYRRYHRVVAVSEEVARALVTWLPETGPKVRVVYNGVEPGLFDQPPGTRETVRQALRLGPQVPLLLSVGGLQPRKGNDVLLDALAQLASWSKGARPTLLVGGDGASESALRAQTAALGLRDDVRFLGYRQDMPALMAAADLLVSASRWEGCPMVILEAMASGLPIVATAVGGVPELITDGVSGRLVPPEDPTALAEAIDGVLGDVDLARDMAARARRRVVADFTADVAARKLLDLYRDELSSRPRQQDGQG